MIKKLLVIFSLAFAFSFGSVLADFSEAFAKNENKTEQTNRRKKKKSSKKKTKKSSGKKKSTGKKKYSSKKKTGKKYTGKKKYSGKKKYTSKKKKGKRYASKKRKSSRKYTSRSYTPRYSNTTSGPNTYTPPKTYGSDDNSNVGREYQRSSDESGFKKEPKKDD
ncbi:MAG TPA: hypothetical protein VHP32_10165 [Ignavibacteria bacterium]|nr:hypothetical protein [Ignavibacteria bacterium]